MGPGGAGGVPGGDGGRSGVPYLHRTGGVALVPLRLQLECGFLAVPFWHG
jgi:hypothetical protein